MEYLVATDSVHTTAAACDYLEGRIDTEDTVSFVTVSEDGRDAGDTLNVATARLLGTAEVKTDRLESDDDIASAVLAAANDRDADSIIVGPHAGTPEAGPTLGSTARRIAESAAVPVVIVPLSL